MKIGIIGLGFVGGAIFNFFSSKNVQIKGYDLYNESDTLEEVLDSTILFLCLPTVFLTKKKEYNKEPIISTCKILERKKYNGIVIIKSTVEPTTTAELSEQFSSLKLVHNPEFLTAATAHEDFRNQKHIVLGKSKNITDKDIEILKAFYKRYFPEADISVCSSDESESMKIFANSFYAIKIQYFNEMYAMCKHIGADYNKVRDMIVKNGWVNPMHTNVPGTDGKLSYGGLCFPKDTNAIMHQMSKEGLPCAVINAAITERNTMRNDKDNCE